MKKFTDVKNIAASPAFRSVSFTEATRYSPWLKRLTQIEDWEKKERNIEEILKEYNEGWYGSLLKLWEDFSGAESNRKLSASVTVQRFFYQVAKRIAADVEKNKEVYQSSKDEYLFSSGDEFMVGDLVLGEMVHQNMIVNYIDEQISRTNLKTVVETGCGTGVNLFYLYLYSEIERFRGGEICSNAVELGNRISRKFEIDGEFLPFNYQEKSDLERLTGQLDDYLLITCHSIEQIQVRETNFIENVLSLPNPPRLVIHFEPVVWNDDSLMSRLCKRYAEKNKYNLDLLETVKNFESENRLEILDIKKRYFGLSAFNPTTIVCWQPK